MQQVTADNELRETRLQSLRDQLVSNEIHAFVVTSHDEHREELKDYSESFLMFISGLTFRSGKAVVKET